MIVQHYTGNVGKRHRFYIVGHKNMPLYFCPYLCQLLTNFQNSFTDTRCKQFAIMRLFYILAQGKCVSTLPCEI